MNYRYKAKTFLRILLSYITVFVLIIGFILTVFTLKQIYATGDTENDYVSLAEKEILILNGFQYGLPVADIYTKSLVDTLKASGIPVNNIYVEYLNLNRKDNKNHRDLMLELLSEKSKEESINMIIAIDQVAADFIVDEARDLFEDVPLIVSYDAEPIWEGEPRELIIAAASNDAQGTIKYAFDLFPDTKNVIFIMGKDDERAPFIERLITAIEERNSEITIEMTDELPYAQMLEKIDSLPSDTIAFYGSYFMDIDGELFVPAAVANIVSQVANVPVFAFADMHIIQGLVGGSVVINEKLGKQVADAAVDFFNGTLILTDEPTRITPDFYPLFDWQQMKLWGADPDLLPSNTLFLNYEPTIWESHSHLIIAILIFIAILISLVIMLLISNRNLKTTLEKLNQSQIDLIKSHDATIEGWAYALDLKDKETEHHSRRVTELTLKIAKEMNINEEDMSNIRKGALLHDIGKMSIPDFILLKPGKLTDEEWEVMYKHPTVAFRMLSKFEHLIKAAEIPYNHHEKWDGSGYPRGLKGEEIPLSARIFAIVDVYDALTSDRPYRKAWPIKKALAHIREQSGNHFDPTIVEVFLRQLKDEC